MQPSTAKQSPDVTDAQEPVAVPDVDVGCVVVDTEVVLIVDVVVVIVVVVVLAVPSLQIFQPPVETE